MNYIQAVFSPTGGTKKAAEAVVAAWGEPIETVDLTGAETDFSAVPIGAEDLVLIAVPSFEGRVPSPAAERMGRLKGNGAACVLLCVYGNRAYEDTLVEMQDIAERSGFRVLGAIAAVAEHSIMHQYAAGRPDHEDVEALRRASQAILEKFRAGAAAAPLRLPGSRPYRKAGGVGVVPKAGKNCTACSLCAQKCPTGAIQLDSIRTGDSKKCITCMRCVALCPVGARKVPGPMVAAASLALKKACSGRKECEMFL